jgi:hypothetical protein
LCETDHRSTHKQKSVASNLLFPSRIDPIQKERSDIISHHGAPTPSANRLLYTLSNGREILVTKAMLNRLDDHKLDSYQVLSLRAEAVLRHVINHEIDISEDEARAIASAIGSTVKFTPVSALTGKSL